MYLSAASAVLTKLNLQRMAWVVAGVAAVSVAVQVVQYEGDAIDMLFVAAAIGTIGAIVTLISRRPLFALTFTTALVAGILVLSKAKQETMNMVLHAYDIVFYFGSWSTLSYLLDSYRSYTVGFVAGLTAVIVVSILAHRIDAARVRRSIAALAAAGFAIVTLAAGAARSERMDSSFFYEDRYVSAFFSSLSDTVAVLWRGNLIEAANVAPGPTFQMPATCPTAAAPPNIILIHQELAVPPSYFPKLAYDRGIDRFFRSYDGRLHRLGVETYAGASWLTEFSVLTGLSSHSFGSMRPFVQTVMAGKLHDTLPQVLGRCGYVNLLVYPMLRNFVSNARFYDQIGFDKILDAKDQNASQDNERDRFYYGNALTELERHFAGSPSPRPMFLYVLTQATHGDYDFTYMPEVAVPGGGPGTNPEVHEYLRRLGMAAMDYDFLKTELARRFPGRPFLIVNYGDHQPIVTRTLLGSAQYSGILSVDRHPAAFSTYYSVDAVGYRPPALPSIEQVDVPYLGTILLEAARLPLPDSYLERKRLMSLCNGHYHGCDHKADILRFHRRLMDSGLMDAM